MPERDPRLWKKGDKFSAAHLNESVEGVMPLTRLHVQGHNFYQTPKGTIIAPQDGTDYSTSFFAVLTSTGPSYHSADFPDERYWGKYAFPKSTTLETDQLVFEIVTPALAPSGDFYEPFPFCVTNLPEVSTHTHSLPVDETFVVTVHQFINRDGTVIHHYMESGGGGSALKYARFIAFAGDNLITAHPCNADASTIDLATTIYLMMTFPAGTSNRPPFATFVANVDVLGYFSIPTTFAITLSGHIIAGVLESFTQWPYASKVGQGPFASIASTGSMSATIIWDWPTLHPIP